MKTMHRACVQTVCLAGLIALAACGRGGSRGGSLGTRNMPAVAGQEKTCAGPREKTFTLDVVETSGIDLGMGTTFVAWTYDGRVPGPTLEACEGDSVTIAVHNRGTTSHGLDTHALTIDARKFGPVGPGQTLTIHGETATPGVFMYHCSAGSVTDFHIKSGLHGAMIVYPRRTRLRPAREIVVVEDAVFGTRDSAGRIPGTDPGRTQKNDPAFWMFNGRLDNDAVTVDPGDLVRMFFVNVGPSTAAAHVVGSIIDRAIVGGTSLSRVQTVAVPAGSGAILEFLIPEAGVFPFVDHDKLAYLPYGLSISFATRGVSSRVH
jgi:nitrite reductase (NO-forming)